MNAYLGSDYATVRDWFLAGDFDDTGRYYAPSLRPDGAIQFPSGVLHPDGSFCGARRLYEMLCDRLGLERVDSNGDTVQDYAPWRPLVQVTPIE